MISIVIEDRLTILTLNRPDKANALTEQMLQDLAEAVRANTDQNALFLTGAGRVFSAGADLDAAKAGLATSAVWEELSQAIADFKGLTVAALNGTVAGGAFGMVLACDLRIAAPHAKFFYPVVSLGYLPQPSDPKRLRALVGPAAAKRILVAGEKIGAADALRVGLIDDLAEDEDVLNVAKQRIAAALEADFSHLQAIKSMI